jgi:hypothetical protein
MITSLIVLMLLQINAGPTPEQLGRALAVHRYGIEPGMGTPEALPFPTARYLAIASHLQSLPERERVTWLRMASASTHLCEPSVYIGRMLITAKDKPLRGIYAYVGNHAAGKASDLFADAPIEIYNGVPFLVADYAGGTGHPESASDYIEYLLANGKWREIQFVRRTNQELTETATLYLEHLQKSGFTPSSAFIRSINDQAGVPLTPSPDKMP